MSAQATADKGTNNDEELDWDADSEEEVSVEAEDDDAEAADEDLDEPDEDDEGADGDVVNGNPQKRALDSYSKLLSRRVDLVGDYAGDELFLIEGDSMLLRCFSDDKLDFDPGFQILHAANNVEHFLHNLVRRKCNFHIVFFECNRQLCLPPTANAANSSKYLFARAAIIRHLQVNLAQSHPGIAVKLFQSYDSPDFAKYLSATGPYFVMMHDGALPVERKGKHIRPKQADQGSQKVGLRGMILNFISRGYNVAFVNGLEWRDTKVMTIVLEARHRTALGAEMKWPAPSPENIQSLDVSEELSKLRSETPDLTERQLLLVIVISQLLRDPPSGVPHNLLPQLCCFILLQQALLTELPLSARRFERDEGVEGAQPLLCALAGASEAVLLGQAWNAENTPATETTSCDVVDFVDGRLFLQLSHGPSPPSSQVQETFQKLMTAVHNLSKAKLELNNGATEQSEAPNGHISNVKRTENNLSVMPFSNSVFDKHLEPVRLKVDETVAGQQSASSHRIFQELTHWHNAKKPIIQKGLPTAASAKAAFWAAKREQMFMAEMQKYAASLTNAVGRSLEPESIIVGAAKPSAREPVADSGKGAPVKAKAPASADSDDTDSSASTKKPKPGKGGGGGGKNAQKNAGKQAMLASIAASKAKKEESAGDKIVSSWHVVCKNIEADTDPRSKFRKVKDYITNLQAAWREVVAAECQLYMLSCVVQYWIDACRRKEQEKKLEVVALIWNLSRDVMSSKGLTQTIVSNVDLTVSTLGLPAVPQASTEGLPDRKLGFTFALPAKVDNLGVKLPSKDFQLSYCGPYMEQALIPGLTAEWSSNQMAGSDVCWIRSMPTRVSSWSHLPVPERRSSHSMPCGKCSKPTTKAF